MPRVDASAPANSKIRPPPRLFSAAEVLAGGGDVSRRRFKVGVTRDGAAGAARDWPMVI